LTYNVFLRGGVGFYRKQKESLTNQKRKHAIKEFMDYFDFELALYNHATQLFWRKMNEKLLKNTVRGLPVRTKDNF
jgi:hypothetical protein